MPSYLLLVISRRLVYNISTCKSKNSGITKQTQFLCPQAEIFSSVTILLKLLIIKFHGSGLLGIPDPDPDCRHIINKSIHSFLFVLQQCSLVVHILYFFQAKVGSKWAPNMKTNIYINIFYLAEQTFSSEAETKGCCAQSRTHAEVSGGRKQSQVIKLIGLPLQNKVYGGRSVNQRQFFWTKN